jgi:hypothetical protein
MGRFARYHSVTVTSILNLGDKFGFNLSVTGMRFGLMQIKTGLIHILSHYEVTPCVETPVPVVFDENSVLLQIKGEVKLSFKKIQK